MDSKKYRRLLVSLLVAGIAATTLAAPALGRSVSHGSGTARVAQVIWGTYDIETDTGDWGNLAAFDQDGALMLSFHEQNTVPITCGDGASGVAGTFSSGFGEAAQLVIARNLSSAVASGTMIVETGTLDTCAMVWELTGVESVEVSMNLVAVDRRTGSVDRYTESIDGWRFSAVSRIAERSADGSVLLDGTPMPFVDALISVHRWNEHSVGG
jgi:hypothetical protein